MAMKKKFVVMEVEDGEEEPKIYTKEDIDNIKFEQWHKDFEYRIKHDKEIRKEVANEIFRKIEKKGKAYACIFLPDEDYEKIKKEVGV